MDVDAANKLQAQIQGSREKYTYFLLTAAGACIAYAVEKVAGFALEWRLVALALSLVGWSVSFWFGCRAIRRSEYGLRYNHARISAVRLSMDKAALDSLMNDEARVSASSTRRIDWPRWWRA